MHAETLQIFHTMFKFTLVAIGTKIFKMADAILKTLVTTVIFFPKLWNFKYERMNNFVEKYV